MKILTFIQLRLRQWRRRLAANRQKEPLREFVYLDEVSVYSLNASRLGPIAAEFTETQTTSLQGEAGGSVGVNAGLSRADLTSRFFRSQTTGSQVLRKSTVQTTFKELYELERKNETLSIQPPYKSTALPNLRSSTDLIVSAKALEDSVWVINPKKLNRGSLFELEVELESEGIFNLSVVASTIHEILEEDAEVLGPDSSESLLQMKSIGRILEKLLVGLVPLRGKAVNYYVVKLDGKEWIVHRQLLDQLSDANTLSIYPLFIVGVAEQTLFWKDIRRILFSKAHYNLLGRVAQSGIQDSWTPIKLAQVFETVMPVEIAGQMNFAKLNEVFKTAVEKSHNRATESKQQHVREALINYANLLAKHNHLDLAPENQEQIALLADQNCLFFGNHNERYKAFESIAIYLTDSFNIEQDSLIFAKYRENALEEAGLDMLGNPTTQSTSNNSSLLVPPQEYYLDSEFVAIYW